LLCGLVALRDQVEPGSGRLGVSDRHDRTPVGGYERALLAPFKLAHRGGGRCRA
jgi:hypothetical protein